MKVRKIINGLMCICIICMSLMQTTYAKPSEKEPHKSEYNISYRSVAEQGDGFIAQFTIKNNTKKAMTNWSFDFDYNMSIEKTDNVKMYIKDYDKNAQYKYHYQFKGKKEYETIPANSDLIIQYWVNSKLNINDNPQNYNFRYTLKEKELPVIKADLSRMELNSSGADEFYLLNDKINNLTGTLTNIENVKEFTFELKNSKNFILQTGKIEPALNWSIKPLGFIAGSNELTLHVKTVDDINIEKSYIIINSVIENQDNLNVDLTTDSDGDGISDYYEKYYGTDPNKTDTDDDGLSDMIEFSTKTDSLKSDTDDNGITDGNEDYDSDGLTNKTELRLGTNLTETDTDGDGLSDGEEVNIYKTNPTEFDTDGDGVNDKKEIEIGTDPLSPDDIFNVTSTPPENETRKTRPSVTIENLPSNLVDTLTVSPVDDETIFSEDIPGYIDVGYNFKINGEFEKAQISFEFNEELGSESFLPCIYYYNEKTQLLEEVPEQTIEGNVVSVDVTHFSKYILLNKIDFDKVWDKDIKPPMTGNQVEKNLDIAFVLDSSGSMYPNDPSNLRISLTKEFIDKLSDTDRAAIIDFDSYSKVWSGFTSDKNSLKKAVDKIDSDGGTDIYRGLDTALKEFDKIESNKHLKVIFLLTDGDDGYSNSAYDSLLYKAKQNNIIIYTVGLGDVNSTKLKTIAGYTGGKYYSASEADDLQQGFDEIKGETVDYITDSNADGISDYFTKLLCEGKLLTGTGRKLFYGIDFDDIQKNADYDGDGLKNGDEIEIKVENGKVYARLISDPRLVDSDRDGIKDPDDEFPLHYDTSEMFVYNSAYLKGVDKKVNLSDRNAKLYVSDDLAYNDYTYDQLKALGLTFAYADIEEWKIWGEFYTLISLGSISSPTMRGVLNDMLNKFRYGNNSGGKVTVHDIFKESMFSEYRNPTLSKEVITHGKTQKYYNDTKDIIINRIIQNDGDISKLSYDFINRESEFKYTIYEEFNDKIHVINFNDYLNGLQLAIHGFHSIKITIKNYKFDGKNFSGTLHYEMNDHFGLDSDDLDIKFGFADWFTLQHYERFNGKYKPFIVSIEHDIDFHGSI